MSYMLLILVIIVVLILGGIVFVIQQNRQQKVQAQQCAKEVQRFNEKLAQLSDPSHFFTDEELTQLKKEFNPVLLTINRLYDSSLISNDYLDNLGLHDFVEKRRILNHIQLNNNRAYKGE